MNHENIQIDPEFEQYISPLLTEELKQLEENILKDGAILSPLILGNGIIVDGQNRYRIAQKHPEISYTTVEREFPDRYAALAWICRNQLGKTKKFDPMQKIADDMLEIYGEGTASDMLYELEDAAETLKFRWEMCLSQNENHRIDPANIPRIDALVDDLLTFLNQVKAENQKITAL